ncbi:hypothetical protein CPB84DRAFT_1797198 [Gymnopilus junonius]|uniref:Uncharacterized protein n=1 Tax=Gymnopilus junonius TaxID=109634 RepID=A0A9P5TH95_GYMJU|nr:hypothetical protein CPB84DRAFT_1797198 [Gymnopilus junonius]
MFGCPEVWTQGPSRHFLGVQCRQQAIRHDDGGLKGPPILFISPTWFPPCRCSSPPTLKSSNLSSAHGPLLIYSNSTSHTLRGSTLLRAFLRCRQAGHHILKVALCPLVNFFLGVVGTTTFPVDGVWSTRAPLLWFWGWVRLCFIGRVVLVEHQPGRY